jgi:membrane-associated protein
MNELYELVLTNLVAHGPPVLFAAAYLGSLGIPFPISLIVVAGGAFVQQGILDWRLALVACLAGSVLADNSEYLLGHLAVRWLEVRFGQRAIWQQSLATFNRQGGLAILLTRVWLSTFAPVVNLIAGGRYPYRRFLFFDVTGEFLWILLYGGLGYLFGGEWELISPVLNNFTGLSIGLVALAVGVYLFLRYRRKAKSRG